MPPGIKVLHHDLAFKNYTINANDYLISAELNIRANEVGTLRLVLTSDPGITKLDNCNLLLWYDSDTPLETGKFYIDSTTQDSGQFVVDCLSFDYSDNPKGKYVYTGLTLNNVVIGIALDLGIDYTVSTNGSTLVVGQSSTTATQVSLTGDTSKLDAIFKAGRQYGFFHYMIGDRLYSIDYTRYWNETAPFINQNQVISYVKNYNTIDTAKSVTGARFRSPPSTMGNYNIPWVEYGDAVSLLDEGYNENIQAGNARIFGEVWERTKNVKNFVCTIEGSSAANYLPGRRINVNQSLTGTAESNVFVVRDVSHNYSASGWTMTLNLQRADQ